ncbi:TetR/AcrR family transcriptional regulator [Rhodobacter sp. NTK016B]|uniref:TetR/AcrR family transcriptional regulator n=1 Tax=Rhodobacter sp. NTK016B TaxID=2759676 RepID=UPI001A8F283E|nr:TetR/AcrR family transcriptional regulator [Rhodobacter sp. NTK016B]MBN8293345.1 TetR/AcrR family transcriptional regulator [Rhodobacter sp. NTK016B]
MTRRAQTRIAILDAAEQAFRDHGYGATAMEDIARRAGVVRKTLYNAFASKEYIAEHLVQRAEAASEPLYRHRIAAGEDALALLAEMLTDSAGWCLQSPELAAFALSPRIRPAAEPPADGPSFQRIIRDTIAAGQAQGQIRRDEDAGFLALMLLGIYAQHMTSVLAGAAFDPGQIRRILRVLVEGIGA